jgi:NAD(P)-dependent dehydrogenase (short-subunit alcohol dehydrogenase family)
MPTALITGVNRGLGLEFIRQYASAGWTVIGTCRDPESAGEARALADAHANLRLYPLDVTDSAAVQALADELEGTAIDVLILNAGVMGKKSLVLGELDPADFLQVLNVNVVAAAMCLQAFRSHVAMSEQRKIIGIGSFLGSIGSDSDGGLYSYRAAKAGIHAVMHAASNDLRDAEIIALPMHPGWVQTDMGGPDALISTAESIAGMIRVIDGLTPQDSGRLQTYSGEELPW